MTLHLFVVISMPRNEEIIRFIHFIGFLASKVVMVQTSTVGACNVIVKASLNGRNLLEIYVIVLAIRKCKTYICF